MRLNKDFIIHEVGGEHVLVSAGNTKFSGLARGNETAAFIIECLKTEATEKQIVDAMTENYEVDRETAEADVKKIIDKLRSIGAIIE